MKKQMLAAALICIFLSSGLLAGSDMGNIYNTYSVEHVFDQKAVTSQDGFSHLARSDQEELLQEAFEAKRAAYYRGINQGHLKTVMFSFAPIVLYKAWVYYKSATNFGPLLGQQIQANDSGSFGVYTILLGIGMQFGWQSFTALIESGAAGLSKFTFGEGSQHTDPLGEMERLYVRKKPWIDSNVQKAVEHNFHACRLGSRTQDKCIMYSKIAMGLATKVKRLEHDSSFRSRLHGFDVEHTAEIGRIVFTHIQHSSTSIRGLENGEKFSPTKNANYFYGEPGTGKTYLVELLAEELELPLKIIKMANLDRSDLEGTPIGNPDARPGKLLEALSTGVKAGEQGHKNMIILLDDADRSLNKEDGDSELSIFLLHLLEPKTSSFHNPYLDIDVDISNVLFILAGNFDIKNAALKNRFNVVHFKGFSKEYKEKYVFQVLLPKIFEEEARGSHVGPCNLNLDYEKSIMNTEGKAEIQAIINELENKSDDSEVDVGMRTIEKEIRRWLHNKVMKKVHDPAMEQQCVNKEVDIALNVSFRESTRLARSEYYDCEYSPEMEEYMRGERSELDAALEKAKAEFRTGKIRLRIKNVLTLIKPVQRAMIAKKIAARCKTLKKTSL